MHYIKNIFITLTILLPVILFATNEDKNTTIKNEDALAVFYTINGNVQEKYNTFVEKKLQTIGFKLTDPHKRVNDQYETKWGSTVLDVLSFMPIVNDHVIIPLLNIDPRIAGFAPFNFLIHKKLDENVTHIGHLMPKVMLKILDIQDHEVKEKFTETFTSLDALIEKEFGGIKSYTPYKKLPEQTMINFEYEFDAPEDMDEFIEEFQNKFELAFIDKGYLIAGYHNFIDTSDEAEVILAGYDAFWTYSLCHLEFSYNMFDNEGARPEAGLFAPCTMYIYIKKGSNKMVVGMFRLHNWSDTLNITSKKRIALVNKLDTEIPEILTNLGMKATKNVNPLLHIASNTPVNETSQLQQPAQPDLSAAQPMKQTQATADAQYHIVLPAVPKPPKAITFANSENTNRAIKFSKRVPPNYVPHSFDKRKKIKSSSNMRIGEVNKGRISAYLRGPFIEVEEVKEKLKTAGFKVLVTAPVNKKGDLISIVFTDNELMELSSKPKRGFMASLRVLVDTKEKTISITNPIYLAKGFLQDEYDDKEAHKLLVKLLTQFSHLQNSKDALKFQLLSKYQFMKGMPVYEDMIEVASGDDLLERVKDNKNVVFTQTLKNGSTLVGVKLGKRTSKFTKRIGRNNAAMLPYPVLIENGKAMILDPKYYIAYMYPLLQMSEFMTIATIPDAMVKDCERVFRKKK